MPLPLVPCIAQASVVCWTDSTQLRWLLYWIDQWEIIPTNSRKSNLLCSTIYIYVIWLVIEYNWSQSERSFMLMFGKYCTCLLVAWEWLRHNCQGWITLRKTTVRAGQWAAVMVGQLSGLGSCMGWTTVRKTTVRAGHWAAVVVRQLSGLGSCMGWTTFWAGQLSRLGSFQGWTTVRVWLSGLDNCQGWKTVMAGQLSWLENCQGWTTVIAGQLSGLTTGWETVRAGQLSCLDNCQCWVSESAW